MTKIKMVCSRCGSDDVLKDAFATWDIDTQEWVLLSVYDDTYCNKCDESQKLKEEEITDA